MPFYFCWGGSLDKFQLSSPCVHLHLLILEPPPPLPPILLFNLDFFSI